MQTTTYNTFEADLSEEGFTFVKFGAEWCPPCKLLTNIMRAFAVAHPEVNILDVDVDTEKALVEKFSISSVPTVMVFKNRVHIKSLSGLVDRRKLEDVLDN